MLDHHSALIYTMVVVSAADGEMTDKELIQIGDTVRHLPVFQDYDLGKLTEDAEGCAAILADEDGLERVLDHIVAGLPSRMAETAYALACDVAAVDGHVEQEEARLLEMLRHHLKVDRLAAAAIERGARARYRTL